MTDEGTGKLLFTKLKGNKTLIICAAISFLTGFIIGTLLNGINVINAEGDKNLIVVGHGSGNGIGNSAKSQKR